MRSGQGNPDEARSARYILKDYVNAKLLYCHPPPGLSTEGFNEQTQKAALERATGKKKAPVTRVGKESDTFVNANEVELRPNGVLPAVGTGQKSNAIDNVFFANTSGLAARPFVKGTASDGKAFTRARTYPHQNMVADDGTPLGGRRARIAAVLASAGGELPPGKKHHKKDKRVKQRSGKGYDLD